MKKKLFTLLTLLVAVCSGAWGDKVGFTSSKSSSTVSAPVVTTQDNITVAIARGGQSTGTGKKLYWGTTSELTFNGTCERTKYGNSALAQNKINDNVWTGASFAIGNGYKFTVTDIQVDIAGNDYVWIYKLEVVNGDGTVEYTASGEIATPKNTSKRQVTATGQSLVLTGTSYVKLYFALKSTQSDSKYINVPELYLTGTVTENVQTNYTKPSITQGTYNQSAGTYPVTLAVQNEEDGTINYTVGNNEEVTGAASGTVINVAPETTITAYVTGSTYSNSDNNTLTTSAAPKLATPTYAIGNYDLMKNLYTVTLSAAAGDIKYTIGGSTSTYSNALQLAPGTAVEAYATQTNMTNSDKLSFTVPSAPTGGSATSPTASGTYSNNTSYNMGAITIPGACIAGQISSGSSPINNSIKTRTNQSITGSGDGFYVTVNPGYIVTGITIVGCSNNSNATNKCEKVYVDGVALSDFEAVTFPKPVQNGSTGTIDITDINAASKIEFDFETNDQAQMNISVTYKVSASATLTGVSGYSKAFATFCAPNNFTVTGAKAYKAKVSDDKIKLTEIDGVIPANTAVVIAGEDAASYTLTYVSDAASADVTENDLKGVCVRTQTSELAGSKILLALNSSAAEFQEYNGTYFPANKAYLLIDSYSPARQLVMTFENDEEPTAIKSINETGSPVITKKYLRNGKLVIETAKGVYNMQGISIK